MAEFTLPYNPVGNTDVTTTGLHADDERIFNVTIGGPAGNQHIITPYPLAGDYDNAMQWTLRGPGGAAGPKLWRLVGKSPPCRINVGPTLYTKFGDSYSLYSVGVTEGQTYAFAGVKDPNADPYTGSQMGNTTCTLTHGA